MREYQNGVFLVTGYLDSGVKKALCLTSMAGRQAVRAYKSLNAFRVTVQWSQSPVHPPAKSIVI